MKVTIADIGIGNLHSLRKAVETCGYEATATTESTEWLDARCLLLPGVGAFGAGMRPLAPVRDALVGKMLSGAPVLGVCLGLQLLLERSDEDPGDGLAFIRGDVKRFPPQAAKIPHMGWSPVRHQDDPLFDGIPQDSYFYFVHSYYPDPEEDVSIADTKHGISFVSSLHKENTYATQFHPEKSGPLGLQLLKNFLAHAEAVQ